MLIYTHPNLLLVENAKNLLESENIPVTLRNTLLASGAGELAPTDTWPELWLESARHESKARLLLAKLSAERTEKDWICPNCGEKNYPSFNLCWNCQHRQVK